MEQDQQNLDGGASDPALLERYVKHRAADALEALVRRHAGWVHAAAARRLGGTQHADDVTQAVFLVLARRPPGNVRTSGALAGWLFEVVRHASSDVIRSETRRRRRERVYAMEHQESTAAADACAASQAEWNQISPHLDAAIQSLPRTDREALLLRFYQRKDHADVAAAMGVAPEAARKRVQRAVVRLRDALLRRGIVAPPSAVLIGLLEIQVTPTASPAIAATVAATQAGATTAQAITIAKGIIVMATIHKTLGIAAAVAAGLLIIGGGTMLMSPSTPPATIEVAAAPAAAPPMAAAPADPQWRQRFDQVYRLEEGEMLKIIPRPFIPERLIYFRQNGGQSMPNGPEVYSFRWKDGGISWWGASFRADSRLSVADAINLVLGLKASEVEMPAEMANFRIDGDWIIRDGLTPAERLEALCALVRQHGGPSMGFTLREMQRTAIVASGQFTYQRAPGDPSPGGSIHIHLYREPAELAETRGGGGMGTLEEAIKRIGSYLKMPVVTEFTGPIPASVSFADHRISELGRLPAGPKRDQEIQKLLARVAEQTGLKVTMETRAIPLWIAEPAAAN